MPPPLWLPLPQWPWWWWWRSSGVRQDDVTWGARANKEAGRQAGGPRQRTPAVPCFSAPGRAASQRSPAASWRSGMPAHHPIAWPPIAAGWGWGCTTTTVCCCWAHLAPLSPLGHMPPCHAIELPQATCPSRVRVRGLVLCGGAKRKGSAVAAPRPSPCPVPQRTWRHWDHGHLHGHLPFLLRRPAVGRRGVHGCGCGRCRDGGRRGGLAKLLRPPCCCLVLVRGHAGDRMRRQAVGRLREGGWGDHGGGSERVGGAAMAGYAAWARKGGGGEVQGTAALLPRWGSGWRRPLIETLPHPCTPVSHAKARCTVVASGD